MGTPIPGTVIAAKVTTGNTDNLFAVADANEIQGGHQSVATLADRNAISTDRRVEGMTCWVISAGTAGVLYRLIGGIDNTNWTEATNASPPLSTLPDVSIPSPTAQQVLAYDGSKWVAADPASTASPVVSTFYLDDTASGTAGYRSLTETPTGGTEVTDSVVITAGSGLTAFDHAYLSDYLNRSALDAGLWEFNIYGSVSAAQASFVAAVSTRSLAGAETEIFRTQTPIVTSTSPILTSSLTAQALTGIDPHDKLLVKFYGTTTGTDPVAFTIYHNGTSHYTHFHTPLLVAHNDLAGIQGGDTSGYYHLTLNQSGAVTGAVGGAPTPVNPLVSYQALVTEQGTRSQADQVLQNQITDLSLTAGSVKAVVNAGLTGQSLVGATTAGTVAINSLAAGAGISLSAGANSVLISSGTQSEIGYEDALALEVFQDYETGTLPLLNRGIGWDGPAYALGHSIAVTTGVNGQQTKRLVLSQGEYARKLAWGSNWRKMRVTAGLRFNGTIAPTNPQLYIGICSGTARPFTSGNTLDWAGGGYDGAAVYLATTTPLVGITFSPFLSKRYGVITGYGQGVGSPGKCFSSTGSLVSALMAEIVRTTYTGTQNYTIGIQSANTTNVAFNASYSTLLHTGRLHDVNAGGWGDSASYTITPYNDAAGPHDAISLVYTGNTPLEVAYICATRVY